MSKYYLEKKFKCYFKKILKNFLIFFKVPGEPTSVKVVPINSTTVFVSWKPPAEKDRNGRTNFVIFKTWLQLSYFYYLIRNHKGLSYTYTRN